MESDNIVTHDVFKFEIDDERDVDGKIHGEFVCNGLVRRSALYEGAQYYNLTEILEELMLKAGGFEK